MQYQGRRALLQLVYVEDVDDATLRASDITALATARACDGTR